jgi:hypothetical protein
VAEPVQVVSVVQVGPAVPVVPAVQAVPVVPAERVVLVEAAWEAMAVSHQEQSRCLAARRSGCLC